MLKRLLEAAGLRTPTEAELAERRRRHICDSVGCGVCPDCDSTEWFMGPCGGAGQNIMCANCGSEFCWTEPLPQMTTQLSVGHRPERNWAYGLEKNWVPDRERAA